MNGTGQPVAAGALNEDTVVVLEVVGSSLTIATAAHARKRAQLLSIADGRAHSSAVGYLPPAAARDGREPVRIEAERRDRHAPETSREKPGASEQADAERDLPGDEHAAQRRDRLLSLVPRVSSRSVPCMLARPTERAGPTRTRVPSPARAAT